MNRARIFSVVLGFVLAVLGIARDDRRLINAAIIVLAVGLAIRLWGRHQARQAPPSDPGSGPR